MTGLYWSEMTLEGSTIDSRISPGRNRLLTVVRSGPSPWPRAELVTVEALGLLDNLSSRAGPKPSSLRSRAARVDQLRQGIRVSTGLASDLGDRGPVREFFLATASQATGFARSYLTSWVPGSGPSACQAVERRCQARPAPPGQPEQLDEASGPGVCRQPPQAEEDQVGRIRIA